MASDVLHTALLAGSVYGLPKLGRVAVNSGGHDPNSLLGIVQKNLGCVSEQLQQNLSEKSYFILNEILGKNAWVSVIVIQMLLRGQKYEDLSPDQKVSIAAGSIVFSSLSWLTRFGISRAMPTVSKYVGN